jgi:hypothetical protein
MKTYKCLKCGKEIKQLHESDIDNVHKDQELMWDGGIVFMMSAGYGSKLDGNMFNGAICDECIDTMAQIDSLKYVGDYITGEKEYIPLRKHNGQ